MTGLRIPARPPSETALVRTMGLPQAVAMVVGIIIGASIFVQPSEVTRLVSNVPALLGVWLLAGLLTLCGALVCARLAIAFPKTGGVYVYLSETVSPVAGFLWGWAMFWSMHSGIMAAIAVVFARYVGWFVPLDDRGMRLVAVGGIFVLSMINYVGVRPGSAAQTLLTAAKLAAILAILVLVYVLAPPVAHHTVHAAPLPPLRNFVLSVGAGLFAFGGWHMVTYAAEETRRPEVTIPRALIIGTLIVTACYLGLNAAYLRVLPIEKVLASNRVAADAASVLVGPSGAAFISGLVIVSALGSLNGIILSGPRVYYAMANDGLWFRWMAAIHPRFRTPHLAILAQSVWACVLVATGTYRSLFTRVVYTEWLFFGLMTAGLLRAIHSGRIPVSRRWSYTLIASLFIASCLVIVANELAASPVDSAVGLLLVAAGLPVYYFWARQRAQGTAPHANH